MDQNAESTLRTLQHVFAGCLPRDVVGAAFELEGDDLKLCMEALWELCPQV